MPGMKGDELVIQIHTVRSDLPVILCSGTQLDAEQLGKCRVSKVLLKPFDMDVLLLTVREVLDGDVSG